jgi:hypothetical protein
MRATQEGLRAFFQLNRQETEISSDWCPFSLSPMVQSTHSLYQGMGSPYTTAEHSVSYCFAFHLPSALGFINICKNINGARGSVVVKTL